MPRRTNDFQRLITLIEARLAPDAVVRESVLLRDTKTGQEREVDVLMETTSGIHAIRIAVECRDHARPATAEWIDQLQGKYRDLEVDKVIAVARAGFTAGARKKAEALGIGTLTLEEADTIDWPREIAQIDEIEGVEVDVAIEAVDFTIDDADAIENDPPLAADKILVFNDADEPVGSIADLSARALLQQWDVSERIAQALGETVRYQLSLRPERLFLKSASGQSQRLHGADVLVAFQSRRVVNAPAHRATYGQAQVVHGAVELEGEQVQVALVVKPGVEGSVRRPPNRG
jgi:Restriction endonuclease